VSSTIDDSANVSTNSKANHANVIKIKNPQPFPVVEAHHLIVEAHHLKAVEMEVTSMRSSSRRKISRRMSCIALYVITLTITLAIGIG